MPLPLAYTSHPDTMKKLSKLFMILAMVIAASHTGSGLVRRCFACRSRGELGDCRDPFFLATNSTIIESKQAGVEKPPCSSGWCLKVVEGDNKLYRDDEYGAATERDCMQFPPSDGKERCAEVPRNGKKVYMCFCKGDLCNAAVRFGSVPLFVILLSTVVSSIFQ